MLELNGFKERLMAQVAIARPDHWFKNVFLLPGTALAIALGHKGFTVSQVAALIVGIMATCLAASANYTINEWLDASFDRHHPVKNARPAAVGRVSAAGVYLQWAVLGVAGLLLGLTINRVFAGFLLALLVMGVLYNVRPFRTKDRQYLDVLSESLNNPLRFMLGWTIVLDTALPPSSVLVAYWMGGAFLMATKRYAEFRFIGDAARAGAYRRSFRFYTEQSLLLSAFFYGLSAAFFLGIFLIKYRVEFLLAIPFLALLFTWYLRIGMNVDSVAQAPERLYREKRFVLYVCFLVVLIGLLSFVDMPWLGFLTDTHFLSVGK